MIFRANPSHAHYRAEVRGLELRIVDRPFGEGGPMPEKEKVAVETICAKLTHARLTHRHFTPRDLGLEKLGHVEWVKNSMPPVETITPWLQEALGWGHPRSCPK